MKLINSSVEIIPQQDGIDGIYKQIELAGRTAYKSEDKITEDSAKVFVDMLCNKGHTAPLEHGTIYITATRKQVEADGLFGDFSILMTNKYSVCKTDIFERTYYITTNYRVLLQNDILSLLRYAGPRTGAHEERITARFICSRAIGNELVRHRVFSFVQESTRYCNYSKSKFNNEITYIIPTWLPLDEGTYFQLTLVDFENIDSKITYFDAASVSFLTAIGTAESEYFDLLKYGNVTPQCAREVLPLALKTELVMTGFASDWLTFFKLRCDNAAHPDMRKLAEDLQEKFNRRCEE